MSPYRTGYLIGIWSFMAYLGIMHWINGQMPSLSTVFYIMIIWTVISLYFNWLDPRVRAPRVNKPDPTKDKKGLPHAR